MAYKPLLLLVFSCFFAFGQTTPLKEQEQRTVCYEIIGCFETGGIYPNRNPQSPEYISTGFWLYTRSNRNSYQNLKYDDGGSSISSSYWSSSRSTKFLTHGWNSKGTNSWIQDMKNAILDKGNYNVIIVDWEKGANSILGLDYPQAVANTRVVGAEIAEVIKLLMNSFGANPADFHVIGHSLGGHVAGYAGERITNMGRITGMDPAGPSFEGNNPLARLDPTDARFVDVLHTDSHITLGTGINQPVGHVDFYPNGGTNQPGCGLSDNAEQFYAGDYTNGDVERGVCSHSRAYQFFTDSIRSSHSYRAYKCNHYDTFSAGLCIKCGTDACASMGWNADQYNAGNNENLLFYLHTDASEPYGKWHQQASVRFSSGSSSASGYFNIIFIGSGGSSSQTRMGNDMTWSAGQTYTMIGSHPENVGSLSQLSLSWQANYDLWKPWEWPIFYNPKILLDRVTITTGETQLTVDFCSPGGDLQSGNWYTFNRC